MLRKLFGCCVLLSFVLALLSPSFAVSAEYISGSGCSVSNVGYLNAIAKEYERLNGVKVFVRGGGSVVGIEDLRSGKVDFAASCRAISADDPKDIQFIQVAWDALVFITHKANPVEDITLEKVRSIYSGAIKNWDQLGGNSVPIKLFISRSRKGLSGVEASTQELVLLGKRPVESSSTSFVASSGIVEQMVEDSPGGFATTGFTSARKRAVRMLKVNGVSPSVRTIIDGKYPLKRPLFILVPRQTRPEVRKFIDYVLSPQGQKFISSQGVVSLLDIK